MLEQSLHFTMYAMEAAGLALAAVLLCFIHIESRRE